MAFFDLEKLVVSMKDEPPVFLPFICSYLLSVQEHIHSHSSSLIVLLAVRACGG